MGWPLTGNSLSRFTRLLDDLRQYGDFPFVGSPDDITFLWEVIREASDGALNPPLDDVANRSHYWMLRLISFLGDQIVVPPTPPVVNLGLQWGPDSSTLDLSVEDMDFNAIRLGDSSLPNVTSITWNGLVTVDDSGQGFNFSFNTSEDFLESISFPDLVTLENTAGFTGSELVLQSFSAPKLVSVGGLMELTETALVDINLDSLESVGGEFQILDVCPIVSANFPSLREVGGEANVADCDNLISLLYPALELVGETLSITNCPLLPELVFPLLESAESIQIVNNASLESISFPVLGVMNSLSIFSNANLESISFPIMTVSDGATLAFTGNALTDTSVNHILARAVANPEYVTGSIDISGGTNAAPTGQGIADAAELTGRGVTVTTN